METCPICKEEIESNPNYSGEIDGEIYCTNCVMECEGCGNEWIFIESGHADDPYAPGYPLYDELHNQTLCIDCYEELILCGYCGTQYEEYMDLATPCNWSVVEDALLDTLEEKGILPDTFFTLPEEFLEHLYQEFTYWVHEIGCCVSCIDEEKAEKGIFPKLNLQLLGDEILSHSPRFTFYNPAQTWIAGVLESSGWQLQAV